MNNEMLEIIGKLCGAAVVIIFAYIAPTVRNWLAERMNKDQMEQMMVIISSFVTAAEQLYKTEDRSGSIKKQYVVDELEKLGVIISEQVNAMIEAAVFALPKK